MTRDRVHAQGTKDLFTECARADDKAIKKRLEGGVEETLADIPNFRLSCKQCYYIWQQSCSTQWRFGIC